MSNFILTPIQWYASKCLQTSFMGKKKKPCYKAFANFHSVNTTMANSKLPM